MSDNLTREYPPDFMATWAGCTHLDCLPECRHGLESGYCERLQRAWEAWQCPKCQRVKHDGDCAEDNCPMALSSGERD